MNFGECIRLYREEAGLNKSELARKMGVTPSMVRQYEKKEKCPKLETIEKFADGFGVGLDELLATLVADGAAEIVWPDDDPRKKNLHRIEANEKKLNDLGVEKLADHSDLLLKDKKYRK